MGDEARTALSAVMPERDRTELSLAQLVQQLGAGVDRFDEAFARTVARTLGERAAHVELPTLEAMQLEDVVATLYMDKDLRLVATGNHVATGGACSVRWDESSFPLVPVALVRTPRAAPYTFATLDFSVRGKKARLKVRAGVLPDGQGVIIRALATIGDQIEYRVVGMGTEVSVAPEDLELL
ncbi:MAG: hypothetical protein U1F43_15435 [Myxococcota bacterium]